MKTCENLIIQDEFNPNPKHNILFNSAMSLTWKCQQSMADMAGTPSGHLTD